MSDSISLVINAILAAGAIGLVGVTAWYAVLTRRLAASAEEQIRMGKTPNLLFDVRADRQAWLINLGSYSAHLRVISAQKLDQAWEPVGSEFVFVQDPSEENQFVGGKHVIAGPGELEVNYAIQHLSGKMRWNFYFVYGSTGLAAHSLEVLLDISSDGISVRDQQLRLNQALPHKRTLAELMKPPNQ